MKDFLEMTAGYTLCSVFFVLALAVFLWVLVTFWWLILIVVCITFGLTLYTSLKETRDKE